MKWRPQITAQFVATFFSQDCICICKQFPSSFLVDGSNHCGYPQNILQLLQFLLNYKFMSVSLFLAFLFFLNSFFAFLCNIQLVLVILWNMWIVKCAFKVIQTITTISAVIFDAGGENDRTWTYYKHGDLDEPCIQSVPAQGTLHDSGTHSHSFVLLLSESTSQSAHSYSWALQLWS